MTRLATLATALLLALPFALPLLAHEEIVGDLQFIHPHIPQPAASARTAGGYMAVTNNGAEADRLIGIETDIAAKAELHESRVDANGVGSMAHVDMLEIPAGGTISLERGGLHVMFFGLTRPLLEGERHKAALIFEKAGRVEIEFMIDPPAGQGAEQGATAHGDHGAASD
jgi:copper(I)-binding protein